MLLDGCPYAAIVVSLGPFSLAVLPGHFENVLKALNM